MPEEISSVVDPQDAIIEQYMKELTPKFEISEDDADVVSHTTEKQMQIVTNLDKAKEIVLDGYDKDVCKVVVDFIEETQNMIFRLTISEVTDRLKKITAMGYNLGLRLGENVLRTLA